MVGTDIQSASNRCKAGQLVMMQVILVGLGAGAATALLFASIASGSLLSVLLFYLAPLPIFIAALGWSHWAALLAACSAAAGLAAFFGSFFFIAFLVGIGLPAWWLGYLALLARPLPGGDFEWYPVGRLVLWSAILGALIVFVAIPTFGTDQETFRSELGKAFEKVLRSDQSPDASADSKRLIDFLVYVIPAAAAIVTTITNIFNLWLAARIVKVSGRLRRPWPDLSAMVFPSWAPALLAATVAGSFLANLLGIMSGVFAASLLMAYAVLGFAVLHAITRARSSRGFMLGSSYGAVLLFGWPVLLMSLLGIAETAFDLRKRFAPGGPPAPRPQ